LIGDQLTQGDGRGACRLTDVVVEPQQHRPQWFATRALEILTLLSDAPVNWTTQLIDALRTAAAPTNFSGDWSDHLNDLHLNALSTNANSRDGLVRWKLLGEAQKWAEDRGMAEQANDLLEQWNAIDPSAYLQRHRTEIQLPPEFARTLGQAQKEMIETMTAPVLDPASAIEAIGAPLPATLVAPKPELAQEPNVRRGLGLPSQTISEGRTSITSSDDDLARQEMMKTGKAHALTCADTMLIPALNRIHGKISFNADDWESAWSRSAFVDETAASRLTEATRLFFENRCDSAAHLLCPTIEHMLRRFARSVGAVKPRPPHPGHDYIPPVLGPILERLEGYIDEDRRVWLEHLLADPMGFNFRNEIAHGTASPVNCQRTALLLNAAAWIANLAPPSVDEEE